MSWAPHLVSPGVGIGVGVIYGLVSVRSPAPPIIALIGLPGMLAGKAAVQRVRGHGDAFANALHLKSFSVSRGPETGRSDPPSRSGT